MLFLVKMSKTKQHKALLYCSTEHATQRTADGSSWTVNVGNTIYADKVDAISPLKVTITNLFHNVNQYNNTFTITNGTGTVTVVVPPGQYTAIELSAYTQALTIPVVNAYLTFSTGGIPDTANRFGFVFNSADPTAFVSSPQTEFWDMVGVDPSLLNTVLVAGEYTIPLVGLPGSILNDLPPNMGGEKIVHLACDKIAHGNMVHAKDGKLHDIVLSIPLSNTAYGFATGFVPQEDDSYMIDYRYTCSLASTLEFTLLDSQMRPLPYPTNHHVQMVFKLYHNENNPA
jgi:hypothetical protein